MVGQDSIAIIIETCIAYIEDKLYNELSPYIKALMKAIPPQVKLQPAAYGLYGIHQYFVATFRDFIAYKDLKPQVFQRFRIIGNAIAFLLLLDGAQVWNTFIAFITLVYSCQQILEHTFLQLHLLD